MVEEEAKAAEYFTKKFILFLIAKFQVNSKTFMEICCELKTNAH
jgi:hypothetical protein